MIHAIYSWTLNLAAQKSRQFADWLEIRYMRTRPEPELDMVTFHWQPATDNKDDTGIIYDTKTGKTMIDGRSIEEWALKR